MKKQYSAVLLALVGLFGLSAGARAQEGTVTSIPYEFVAGGKTLPAGTYTITRVSPERERTLEIRNNGASHESAFLLPISSEAVVDHAKVVFRRLGDTYYLSQVATLAGVYTLPTPKAATTAANVRQHDAMPSAGTE